MIDTNKIEKRERRLLRRESYVRRSRRIALGFGIVLLALFGVLPLALEWMGERLPPRPEGWWWPVLLVFALAYRAHLRIQHLDSILYHRSKELRPQDGSASRHAQEDGSAGASPSLTTS